MCTNVPIQMYPYICILYLRPYVSVVAWQIDFFKQRLFFKILSMFSYKLPACGHRVVLLYQCYTSKYPVPNYECGKYTIKTLIHQVKLSKNSLLKVLKPQGKSRNLQKLQSLWFILIYTIYYIVNGFHIPPDIQEYTI